VGSVGTLMRGGVLREGCGAAIGENGTDSPPPPPPRTAAAASAPPRQRSKDSPRRLLSSAAPEARPRRSSRHQPHVLQAELEEIALRASLPEAQTAWYESAEYFASLHPSSVRLPEIELPKEVPSGVSDGLHLAFSAKSAQLRQPRGAGEAAAAEGECLRADFRECLSLRMDRLPSHCVLFLWRRRRSLLGEDTRLLGYRALPLRDASLQGRLAAWDVVALRSGEEVAQVRLRYSVFTTPGPIQLPHLSDVLPTEVTMHWRPPLDDQGAKVLGYQISMRSPDEEQWLTVSECTQSKSFKLDGLIPGAIYAVDIRAVNEAGVGEHSELEVSAASHGEASSNEEIISV